MNKTKQKNNTRKTLVQKSNLKQRNRLHPNDFLETGVSWPSQLWVACRQVACPTWGFGTRSVSLWWICEALHSDMHEGLGHAASVCGEFVRRSILTCMRVWDMQRQFAVNLWGAPFWHARGFGTCSVSLQWICEALHSDMHEGLGHAASGRGVGPFSHLHLYNCCVPNTEGVSVYLVINDSSISATSGVRIVVISKAFTEHLK